MQRQGEASDGRSTRAQATITRSQEVSRVMFRHFDETHETSRRDKEQMLSFFHKYQGTMDIFGMQ